MKEKNKEPLFHIVKEMRFPGINLWVFDFGNPAGTDPVRYHYDDHHGNQSFTGISVHRSGCFRIRPQDLGHFSEYSDPAFDRIGIDSGI